MGKNKKKGSKNRGGLGEGFEESYEYEVDGDEDYGRSQKNKFRNRSRGYDGYGADGGYSEEYEDDSNYDADDEDDAYDGQNYYGDEEDASSNAGSQYSVSSDSNFSGVGVSSSSLSGQANSGFKENKPSPLGSLHRATPTPYDTGSEKSRTGTTSAYTSGVSFRPVKAVAEPQTSAKSQSGRAYDASVSQGGVSDDVEDESGNEEVESRRERKAREKSARQAEKESRRVEIEDLRRRVADLDEKIHEYCQLRDDESSSQEDRDSCEEKISELNAEKESLQGQLRELGAGRLSSLLSGINLSVATSSVKAASKKITNSFAALGRRKEDEAEDAEEDGKKSSKAERDEERLIARQERRERKKARREEKKRSRLGRGFAENSDDSGLNHDEEDGDEPSSSKIDWTRIGVQTAKVTVVASILLVAGYTGYMFLGPNRPATEGDNVASVQGKEDGKGESSDSAKSWLSGLKSKFQSNKEGSSDDSKKTASSAPASSPAKEGASDDEKGEKKGWWNRLVSKFRKGESSDDAKSGEKLESKLAKAEKDASDLSQKTKDGVKSKLDEFNQSLMEQTDSLKNDLEEGISVASQKANELGERLSGAFSDASDELSRNASGLEDDLSGLVDSGNEALGNLNDSLQDVGDELAGAASNAKDSLNASVNELGNNLDDAVSNAVADFDAEKGTHGDLTDNDASTTATVAASYGDDSLLDSDELETVDVDPAEADFNFGNTPVRNPSTNASTLELDVPDEQVGEVAASIDPLPTDEDALTTVAPSVQDETDATSGADWGAAESSEPSLAVESVLNSRATEPVDDGAGLTFAEDELTADASVPTESATNVPQPTSQPSGNASSLAGLSNAGSLNANAVNDNSLNAGATQETPSLLNPRTTASSDSGMDLQVGGTSNAVLELNDDSDMNALSGANNVVADDFDSWNSSPSLLNSQRTSNAGNQLSESLNSLNSQVDNLAGKVADASQNFQAGIQEHVDSFNEGVSSLRERGEQASEALNNSLSTVSNSLEQARDSLREGYDNLSNSLGSAYQSAADSIQNVGDNINNNFQKLQDSFTNLNELGAPSNNANGLTTTSPLASSGTPNNSLAGAANSSLAANGGSSLAATGSSLAANGNSLAANGGSSLAANGGSSLAANGNSLAANGGQRAATNASPLTSTPVANGANSLTNAQTNGVPTSSNAATSTPSALQAPSNTTMTNSLVQTPLNSGTGSNVANTGGNNALSNNRVPANNGGMVNGLATPVNSANSAVANVSPSSSDAGDLMPSAVDYSYSMSPLGQLSSRDRIDASMLATPNASTVSGSASPTTVVASNNVPLGTASTGAAPSGVSQYVLANQNAPANQSLSPNMVQQGAAPGVATGVASGYRQYVTKEGDNLLTIAENELGSSSRWGEIKRLNNLRSGAAYFEVGTMLLLPATGATPGN